jgi:adenylate kinase
VPAVSLESSSPGKAGPNLIFLGPPGAGKGSLAAKLCSLNLEHVSSGEFFRAEVARKTPLGAAFATALQKGEFVPDEPTLSVMRKWLFGRKNSRGFLLDGFPRNLLQAQVLSEWLEVRRESLAACLYLDLPREEAIRRITERRICPEDGTVYHLTNHPPQVPGICDHCGTPLVQRSDDTEETVNRRFRLFEKNTLPVVDYYRNQGLLLSFDASRPIETVQEEILAGISSLSLT